MPARHIFHWLRLALLLVPGLACMGVALLADVLRGGSFVSGWGGGQTVLLGLGVSLVSLAVVIDRKAWGEEKAGRRPYGRTVAFMLVPLTAVVVIPVGVFEGVARWLPESHQTPSSFRYPDPDLGFVLEPNGEYRAISRPKDFDVLVRIDGQGFRRGPGEQSVQLADADVVLVGDSHPFGFGIAEHETLPVELAGRLAKAAMPAQVINAGVPGYGLGQTLLRIQHLSGFRSGGVVVVFINPVNDLVNLSSMVDYHFPKPYPVLEGGGLRFHPAIEDWGEGPFLFSPPFQSLNDSFELADQRRWYHSAAVRRWNQPADASRVIDGVTILEDSSSPEAFLQAEAERIAEQPLLHASRFWPEMPRFDQERETLRQLLGALTSEMARTAAESDWRLLAVVAPEAYSHQTYAKSYLQQIRQAAPQLTIELGWSRQAVLEALGNASIATVAPDYSEGVDSADRFFLQNDDHTSAIGHAFLADLAAQQIRAEGWLLGEDPPATKGSGK